MYFSAVLQLRETEKTNDGRDRLKFIEPLLNKQPMELSVQHSRTLSHALEFENLRQAWETSLGLAIKLR